MIQAATAGKRIAKRHYVLTTSKTIRNATASLAPLYTDPIFARRNNVRYEHETGQDRQPPRPSFYLPYLQGSCWDLDTCD